eukprot:gnl/Carplike_NY0171/2677_a3597_404.p1 GENE.gnl/Carplike_NY0171/2677_a3597_404~~gnl/Carplike_NY0171/2677_a3597_404.p1  ORF type:complete len:770 (-),score=253.44 gnl/Carplike_NY0171/2677_a3597_404:103-2097(-)
MLVAGGICGSIRVFPLPLETAAASAASVSATASAALAGLGKPAEAPDTSLFSSFGHSGGVTTLCIDREGRFFMTGGKDGCICVYKQVGGDVKKPKAVEEEEKGSFPFRSSNALVPIPTPASGSIVCASSKFLDTLKKRILVLRASIEEIRAQSEYRENLDRASFKEKLDSEKDKFNSELNEVHQRLDDSEKQLTDLRRETDRRLRAAEESKSATVQELEVQYQARLKDQDERINRQLVLQREMEEEHAKERERLIVAQERIEHEVSVKYEDEIQKLSTTLVGLEKEKSRLVEEHEEKERQMKQDNDYEIASLRDDFKQKLDKKEEQFEDVSGQFTMVKRECAMFKTQLDKCELAIAELKEQKEKLKADNDAASREREGLKGEVREREDTIQEKEKLIYELKKKNQELSKFKFVLDYKIKELKKQIEPREADINDMRKQIRDMDVEIDRYHKANSALELQVQELEQRQRSLQHTVKDLRTTHNALQMRQRRMESDIQATAKEIQNPKVLKDGVKLLFQRYVSRIVAEKKPDMSADQEHHRQMLYLEKTVAGLRQRMEKDQAARKADVQKILSENVELLREVNVLRRELKSQQQAAVKGAGMRARAGAGMATELSQELKMKISENAKLLDKIAVLEGQLRAVGQAVAEGRPPAQLAKLPPIPTQYE